MKAYRARAPKCLCQEVGGYHKGWLKEVKRKGIKIQGNIRTAMVHGHVECMKELIPYSDMNKTVYGINILGSAIVQKEWECVEALIPHVDLNGPVECVRTGFYEITYSFFEWTVNNGKTSLLNMGLQYGKPEQKPIIGSLALRMAINLDKKECVELLAPLCDLSQTGPDGNALFYAVTRGSVQAIEVLMYYCDIDALDEFGMNPLMGAIQYDHPPSALVLLPYSNLSLKDVEGRDAYEIACSRGHLELADEIKKESERRLTMALMGPQRVMVNSHMWQLPVELIRQVIQTAYG